VGLEQARSTKGDSSLLSTTIAVTASFDPDNLDTEAALAFDLTLEFLEERTFEFLNATAFQACQMNMVPAGARLVIVFSTLEMHKVEFVHQAVFLQHGQSTIDGDLIQGGILAPGTFPQSHRIQVAFSSLNNLDQETTLMSHPQAARNQLLLERNVVDPRCAVCAEGKLRGSDRLLGSGEIGRCILTRSLEFTWHLAQPLRSVMSDSLVSLPGGKLSTSLNRLEWQAGGTAHS